MTCNCSCDISSVICFVGLLLIMRRDGCIICETHLSCSTSPSLRSKARHAVKTVAGQTCVHLRTHSENESNCLNRSIVHNSTIMGRVQFTTMGNIQSQSTPLAHKQNCSLAWRHDELEGRRSMSLTFAGLIWPLNTLNAAVNCHKLQLLSFHIAAHAGLSEIMKQSKPPKMSPLQPRRNRSRELSSSPLQAISGCHGHCISFLPSLELALPFGD